MATTDNEQLFSDEDMRRRYETAYEFLANDGAQCGLSKDYMLSALHHIGEALHTNTQSESLWKAYVLIDVLVDRWDECVSVFTEEEIVRD
ncbi:MAG: hypothetical protein ACK55I_03025, partial [bacterium]